MYLSAQTILFVISWLSCWFLIVSPSLLSHMAPANIPTQPVTSFGLPADQERFGTIARMQSCHFVCQICTCRTEKHEWEQLLWVRFWTTEVILCLFNVRLLWAIFQRSGFRSTYTGQTDWQGHTFTVTAHTHQAGLITTRLFFVLEINKAGSRERGWLSDKLDSGC